MIGAISIWILIGGFIAFLSAVFAAVLKLVIFFRYKNAYIPIFRTGLLGELVGILTVIVLWLLDKHEFINMYDEEVLVAIPFWTMLAGVIMGVVLLLRKPGK